jgi:integrase/recombinase XerC/integrase/recombinase XerD
MDLTLVEATDRYVRNHHDYHGSTEKTKQDYREKLALYARFAQDRKFAQSVRELDETHVRAWVADLRKRGLASASIHGYVGALKALSRWLAKNPANPPILPSDPLAAPAKPFKQPTAKSTIPLDQVARVLAVCNLDRISGLRDRAVVLTLLSSGIRRAELLGLHIEDCELRRRTPPC